MIQALLNSLWLGAPIVLIAAGLIAVVPQSHAATRHAVWFAALVALVLLPLSEIFSFAGSSHVMVLKPVPPDIPSAVAEAHPYAQVNVLVTVAANGRASAAEIQNSSGNSVIDTAAKRAALLSTYKPEMRNCNAVSGGHFLFHIKVGP